MENFNLTYKTNVIFGKGEEKNVGKYVAKYGKSCLVVRGTSAHLIPLMEVVNKSLNDAGVEIYDFPGIVPNPLVSKANEAVELVRKHNIEFILAVGGGSVMDSVKYIAHAVNCESDEPYILHFGDEVKHQMVPHGCIVTLSGTSSEMSNCSMMVDDTHTPLVKHSLTNNCLYYDFAIINPELMYSLPPKQTAAGVMDSISHALEVYLAPSTVEPIMEGTLEGVMRTLIEYGPKALANPCDYEARANIAVAVMMAYRDDIFNGGVVQDWGGHNIENPITTKYNGTHGVTLGIITPAFLRYVSKKNMRPFVNFATKVMGVNPSGLSAEEIVEAGAKALEDWLKTMNLPTRFSELGISLEELEECAVKAEPSGAVYKLSKDEIMEVLKLCA